MGLRCQEGLFSLVLTAFCLLLCIHIGHAGWGEWSNWTPCSATCGNGVQTRIRHCTTKPDEAAKCIYANQTEEYQCYSGVQCSPINGAWSAWEPWSNCTRRCGVSLKERWRRCENPAPQYGGEVCKGSRHETARCVLPACLPLYVGEDQTACSEGYVHCADGVQCIPEYRRCDFWRDCRDGSDESACKEGEPVQIYYNNNSGLSVSVRSFTFPIVTCSLAVWFTANRS